MSDSIVYRKIQSSDLIPLKTLHQEFFPVQYSDSFYIDACQEKGIRNGFLFTLIATIHDEIVGFLLGQFIPHNECEDNAIVESNNRITHLFYILTLGVTKEYRRSRIATTLLERSISYARRNKGCGVVYLHVLTTNQSAIKFYESNHFTLSKELYDFYSFLGGFHNAYLYALYINEGRPSWIQTFFYRTRRMIADGFAVVVSWMQSYLPGQPVHTISQNQPPLNPSSNPTQTEDFLAV